MQRARVTGSLGSYNDINVTELPVPFRSRLISVQLPFLSVFKPFPFCPKGSRTAPYSVIKHAQVINSAGRPRDSSVIVTELE